MVQKMRRFDTPGLFDDPEDREVLSSICGVTTARCRDYQAEIVASVWRRLVEDGYQSTLLVAATGLGKTISAAFAAREWIEGIHKSLGLGKRVLFLAHSEELIEQAAAVMKLVCPGVQVEIEQAEKYVRVYATGEGPATIVIASVQTLCLHHRLLRFGPDYFGFIIIDEAHHYVLKNLSYSVIVYKFRRAKLLGMTATPDRSDELALGQAFESTLEQIYDIAWGRDQGWLVPIVSQLVAISSLDLSDVKIGADGDYDEEDLALRMKREGPLAGIVYPTIDAANAVNAWYSGRRQSLVFGASVEHASMMAEMFNREDRRRGTGKAAVVYSSAKGMVSMTKEERGAIIKAYRAGEITYLCNYGVLTEGFDAPETKIIALGRKTKSRKLFTQMVGRGTRVWPGISDELNDAKTAAERRAIIAMSKKPGMLLIDPIGISGQHKLVSAMDVLGGIQDDTVVDLANGLVRSSGGRMDVDVALRQARVQKEAMAVERRKGIVYNVEYTKRTIDPFDLIDTCIDREPGWFKGKTVTPGQRKVLENAGLEKEEIDEMTFFRASKMIDGIIKRRGAGKCTLAQAKILAKFGRSTDMTFEEAKKAIDEIAAGGWQ